MVSFLIKLILAKRTAVVHWGSYSQPTQKRASPRSQTGGLHHHKHRLVLLQIQFLRHPLCQWHPLDASDSNARGQNKKRAATVALWALELIIGHAQPSKELAQESLRVPLWVPSLLLCRYCPSACPWTPLVLVSHLQHQR